jgi:sulfofructose kinase
MIGMATVDYLYVLDDFPQPDSVTRALDYMTVVGGVAGRAAIAARRLGGAARLLASCGDDVHARFLREQLGAEGVECFWAAYDQPSQHSAVIAARGDATRTIIWLPQPMADARMLARLPEFLDGVDVVLLDATDEALAKAALDECDRRGVATVLDTGSGRPWTPELVDRSRHVIAPEKYVCKVTGLAAEEAIAALWRDDVHEVLAVTQGPSGGVYVTREDPARLRRWDAAPAEAVDSNGAGDTFHGVYAWALARGRARAECFDLAAWAAALKASQPGNAGIPTLEQLERARTSGRARRPA